MKRAEIRARVRAIIQRLRDQGLTGQALLDGVADAVADDWVQEAGDRTDAGKETQAVSTRHMIRLFKGQSVRYPIGWAVLHPTPDPQADPTSGVCPFNAIGDRALMDNQPDHLGTFYCSLSPGGDRLVFEAEVP